MKNLLFYLLLIGVVACNNSEADKTVIVDSPAQVKKDSVGNYIHSFADTALETKITAALLKLPFVIKSNQYIDSFSNHQHGIFFMLDNPTETDSDIHVQAGYNGDQRFETYYRFYVNSKTMEIKVYDAVEDKKLTVKEYLNTQK